MRRPFGVDPGWLFHFQECQFDLGSSLSVLKASSTSTISPLYLAGPGIFATGGASTRPTPSLRSRCAAPSSWLRNGARSPVDAGERGGECVPTPRKMARSIPRPPFGPVVLEAARTSLRLPGKLETRYYLRQSRNHLGYRRSVQQQDRAIRRMT